ncbi:MAG: hypothetical protein NC244_12110 [Alistipes senegalensis]|nr:hypothetical protein [Alistipes senegalensis]
MPIDNDSLDGVFLNKNRFLEVFQNVFSGINITTVQNDSYRLPPEREIEKKLNHNFSRAEIGYHMRRLRDSGVIDSRRGDGNYLVSDVSKAVTNSLEMSLQQLMYLQYFDSKDINKTRMIFELSIYEYWINVHYDEQSVLICELKLIANQMRMLFHRYEALSLEEEKEKIVKEIIDKDISFHKTMGKIVDTTLINIFINAISELQKGEIQNFWNNSLNSVKADLIDNHFSIIVALEKIAEIVRKSSENIEDFKTLESAKNDYRLAIISHYENSIL